jgi:hypothetical protein
MTRDNPDDKLLLFCSPFFILMQEQSEGQPKRKSIQQGERTNSSGHDLKDFNRSMEPLLFKRPIDLPKIFNQSVPPVLRP